MVYVISKTGERLMPTKRLGKVRHLLKDGKAVIVGRNPFTIQLTYDTDNFVQPIEVCVDTGYLHIGVSVKTEAEELYSAQYNLLKDEKERHDDSRRYRRTRRNRRRYRAPRFDNRKASKPEGWLAPSIKNKANRHIDIILNIAKVAPVTSVYIEGGEFDTMLLKAQQEGLPIPVGADYQQGERYGIETLRSAVFQRDGYKCKFCGRTIKDGAILHVHHAYYWRGQHGDSLSELVTCCEKCHTRSNHKEGGKLWGYDKKLPRYTGAAFMNTVKWYIYNSIKERLPDTEVHLTYGAKTKLQRRDLGLEKSHANDAYAMGKLHPAKKATTEYYIKRRRNSRVLEKFYDAKYIDIRDGKKKSGSELGSERTNRREPRVSDKSLRKYRGKKVSKGRRQIRKVRYPIQNGDIVFYNGKKYVSRGTGNYGKYVLLTGVNKKIKASEITILYHLNGWVKTEIA